MGVDDLSYNMTFIRSRSFLSLVNYEFLFVLIDGNK